MRPTRRPPPGRILLALAVGVAGCRGSGGGGYEGYEGYAPQTREITVTTVPLLVKEQRAQFPFLAQDFAAGGVLEGKEVYAFVPGTITVVEGDTIHFTFVNPEDDVHSFVLPGLSVALPGQRVTKATYVASRSGIFTFRCSIPMHLPMMWGQLVVLDPRAMGAHRR